VTATVLVDHSWRGEWEVEIVGERDRVACPTLAEAERLAYAAARRHRPSVVVVITLAEREALEEKESRCLTAYPRFRPAASGASPVGHGPLR
jgi:hypothetical protein